MAKNLSRTKNNDNGMKIIRVMIIMIQQALINEMDKRASTDKDYQDNKDKSVHDIADIDSSGGYRESKDH
jgi:hypothetical protein